MNSQKHCKNKKLVLKNGTSRCVRPLMNKTKPELIKMATGLGIKNCGNKKKSDIVDLIEYRVKNPCKRGKKVIRKKCIYPTELKSRNVKQLRSIAKKTGISSSSKMKRGDLLRSIRRHYKCKNPEYVDYLKLECVSPSENTSSTTTKPVDIPCESYKGKSMCENEYSDETFKDDVLGEVKLRKCRWNYEGENGDKCEDITGYSKDKRINITLGVGGSVDERVESLRKERDDSKINVQDAVNKIELVTSKNIDNSVKTSLNKLKKNITEYSKLEQTLKVKQAQKIKGEEQIQLSVEKIENDPENSEYKRLEYLEKMSAENTEDLNELSKSVYDKKTDVIAGITEVADALMDSKDETKKVVSETMGVPLGEKGGLLDSIKSGVELKQTEDVKCSTTGKLWDIVKKTCVSSCEKGTIKEGNRCVPDIEITDDEDTDDEIDDSYLREWLANGKNVRYDGFSPPDESIVVSNKDRFVRCLSRTAVKSGKIFFNIHMQLYAFEQTGIGQLTGAYNRTVVENGIDVLRQSLNLNERFLNGMFFILSAGRYEIANSKSSDVVNNVFNGMYSFLSNFGVEIDTVSTNIISTQSQFYHAWFMKEAASAFSSVQSNVINSFTNNGTSGVIFACLCVWMWYGSRVSSFDFTFIVIMVMYAMSSMIVPENEIKLYVSMTVFSITWFCRVLASRSGKWRGVGSYLENKTSQLYDIINNYMTCSMNELESDQLMIESENLIMS